VKKLYVCVCGCVGSCSPGCTDWHVIGAGLPQCPRVFSRSQSLGSREDGPPGSTAVGWRDAEDSRAA